MQKSVSLDTGFCIPRDNFLISSQEDLPTQETFRDLCQKSRNFWSPTVVKLP